MPIFTARSFTNFAIRVNGLIRSEIITEANNVINEIKRILFPDGRLVIDFPDIKTDIEKYFIKEPEFMMELIYCNQKNEYSRHKWGYTKSTFKKLLDGGWKSIEWKTIVKHDYPTISCIATRGK